MEPIGLVLGSGLGQVAENFAPVEDVALSSLIGTELQSKIPPLGHKRRLFKARWKGKDLWVLQGRLHYYEGFPMDVVVEPIRYFHTLGVKTVVLTFACGALKKSFKVGDFVAVKDHIHLQSANPLRGKPDFVDCSRIYSEGLSRKILALARVQKMRIANGVYASCDGPSYETPAEVVALRRLGGDVVGMSVTAEAIVARSLGMDVAALGWVSNLASGLVPNHKLSHQEVLEFGQKIESKFSKLLLSFIESI